jgi:hypothetical protein
MPLPQRTRFVHLAFHIDTNRINARQKLPAMNQLEEWKRNRVILLGMSETAFREAWSGNNRTRTAKTSGFMFSQPDIGDDHWEGRRAEIERVLFPAGVRTQNQQNDVLVVFTADKHRHFSSPMTAARKRNRASFLAMRATSWQSGSLWYRILKRSRWCERKFVFATRTPVVIQQ